MKISDNAVKIANSILAKCDADDKWVNYKGYVLFRGVMGTWDILDKDQRHTGAPNYKELERAKKWVDNHPITKARSDAGGIKFEARIYEKAEHWTFDTTVQAKDENDAYKVLRKEYPKSEYSIQSVRAV